MPIKKSKKEEDNIKNRIMDIGKEDKSSIDKILGEIGDSSACKQLLLGTSSGWVTGFVAMKVGKVVAFAIGGGIIILHLAHENNYIKINWSKVNKKLDKVADKVDETITGQGPSWSDKMERYVDRKIDQAEGVLKQGGGKAKKWYSKVTGDEEKYCKYKESSIFFASFIAGIFIGMACS